MRFVSLTLLLLAACASTQSAPVPPLTTEEGRACVGALERASQGLQRDELTKCERDFDCRGVSPLVSGRCGVFANTKAFDAQRDFFSEQLDFCRPVVQVVPHCSQLRPVCREKRCAGEAVAELPDECAAQRTALKSAAAGVADCESDEACTLLEDEPTATRFVTASIDQQEQVARVCGTVPPELIPVRSEPPAVRCVAHRCAKEPGALSAQFVPPVPDRDCIRREFMNAIGNPQGLRLKEPWMLRYKATVDTQGSQRQFEFLEPSDLQPADQLAFASRLANCNLQPGLYAGKPIVVRYVFSLAFKNR